MILKHSSHLQFFYCTSVFAFPHLFKRGTPSASASDPSTNILKWQKNCQDKGYSDLEVEAWDSYYKLAKAAQLWKADGAYQSTADLYFGKDSIKNYKRIMNTFNNLAAFHEHSHWNPGPTDGAYFEIWCAENGPDGLPPRPDPPEIPAKDPWDGSFCETSGAWGFSYSLDRFWWIARRYYTVICEKAWTQRYSLANVTKAIEDGGGKYRLDMNFLYENLRAQTWLHEFTHHAIVSNPNQPVKDVHIKGASGFGSLCYGADCAAALAKWYGSTTPVRDEHGGYNGEFGAAINADNYVMFALSVYFQESLSLQAPIEPKNPAYKNIPKRFVDPVPNHPKLFNASALSGNEPQFYSNETIAPLNNLTSTPILPAPIELNAIEDQVLCINESTADPFQQSFSVTDAAKAITDFCADTKKWGIKMVPPISYGNGQDRSLQFQSRTVDSTGATAIWINLKFFDEGCIGQTMFTQGGSDFDKEAYCSNTFVKPLLLCQKNTMTVKYGGSFLQHCLQYQIQGRPTNVTSNYPMKKRGKLICNPADATIAPVLAGTCTCSYKNYKARDTFKMPSSGNCDDVNPATDLKNT